MRDTPIREYNEGMTVEIGLHEHRLVLQAFCEAGFRSVLVDVLDILDYVKHEYLDVWGAEQPPGSKKERHNNPEKGIVGIDEEGLRKFFNLVIERTIRGVIDYAGQNEDAKAVFDTVRHWQDYWNDCWVPGYFVLHEKPETKF